MGLSEEAIMQLVLLIQWSHPFDLPDDIEDELLNGGYLTRTYKFTDKARELLKSKRLVIVDTTDVSIPDGISDEEMAKITSQIVNKISKAIKTDGIGYTKL